MMKRLTFLVILCAFTAGLAGCASTPQAQFYTLSPSLSRSLQFGSWAYH